MDQDYLPENSLCRKCAHCMVRVIIPLDYEAYGLQELESEESIIVQALCVVSDVDLHDHIVKECNKFEFDVIMKNLFLK